MAPWGCPHWHAAALCCFFSLLPPGICKTGKRDASPPKETWRAATGAPGPCEVEETDDPSAFTLEAPRPLILRFAASEGEVREAAFLAKFGKHPAAVYPRFLMENLQHYKSIEAFAAEFMGANRTQQVSPAPLILSFQMRYKGADELRSDLKRSYRLPAGFADGVWSISLGADTSGIAMHSTHHAVTAAVLWGRKHWYLAPPGALEQAKGVYWDVGPTHKVPSQWSPDLVGRLKAANVGLQECVQEPGTVLLIPGWWWHATWNEGDCLSVNAQLDGPGNGPYPLKQAISHDVVDALRASHKDSPRTGSHTTLKKRALEAVEDDPLQLLRDVGTVREWWRLFLADDAWLQRFAKQVLAITKWSNQSMIEGTLLPEQSVSLAFNLFPFGMVRGQLDQLPRGHAARAAVGSLRRLGATALATGFAEEQYLPHAGIMQAAMHTEAGRVSMASAAMEKYVNRQGLAMSVVADYVGSFSMDFRKFWRKWLMHNMAEL